MREHDENVPVDPTEDRPSADGVALSPYDSDLTAPTADAEPESSGWDGSPAHSAGVPGEPADLPAQPADTPATPVAPAEPAATPPDAPAEPLAEPSGKPAIHAGTDETAAWSAEGDDIAARWSAAGAGAAGAAAGVAATRTDTPATDTEVPRSSLRPDHPSNEPRRLMTEPEADERAERYAPDADLFAGASADKVPSRAGAHWWSLLGTLFLIPFAWYLLSDAGARMTLPAENQWDSGVLNLAALGELLGGIVILAVILIAARASSLGAFVVGSLTTIIGGAFVLFPAITQDFLEPALQWLRDYNDFGGNIAHHLVADGSTGRILVAGSALLLVGVVSHSARRRGRREQTIREAVERRKATGS